VTGETRRGVNQRGERHGDDGDKETAFLHEKFLYRERGETVERDTRLSAIE
jgi:hypothetical protein